jgi:CheY-like chemotaxis protein
MEPGTSGVRVLVFEQEVRRCAVLCEELTRRGYSAQPCTELGAALVLLQGARPDVLVLGELACAACGVELLASLGAQQFQVPVVALRPGALAPPEALSFHAVRDELELKAVLAELLGRLQPAASRSPAPTRPPAAGEQLRVLVVEDDPDTGALMRDILAEAHYQVELATTGKQALELARKLLPAVVLCDVGLPDIDGYEVARALRSFPELRDTRLVAVTSFSSASDVERAVRAGFEMHMAKPPDLDRLELFLAGLARAADDSDDL